MASGDAPPPMPGWVKAFAIVLVVLVVLAFLIAALGGPEHGPFRHMP
ncbi:MAG: hypothetical protein ACT4PT_07755 [Methanobacteriota archaeon]